MPPALANREPASPLKTTSSSPCAVPGARLRGRAAQPGWPRVAERWRTAPGIPASVGRAGLRGVQCRSKAWRRLALAVQAEAHPSLFTLIKLITGFWQIGKKSVCSS